MSDQQLYEFPITINHKNKDYFFKFRLSSIYDDIQINRRADRLYGAPITADVRETVAAGDALAMAELELLAVDMPEGWAWDSPRNKAIIVLLYTAYLEKRLDFRSKLEENEI